MTTRRLNSVYDPKEVVVTFGSTPILDFAEDSFIECDYNEEEYFCKTGADGMVACTRNDNDCCDIAVTLNECIDRSRSEEIVWEFHTGQMKIN